MTVFELKKKLILQAIQVLRELNKQYYEDSSKKKPLLDDEEKNTLYLQIMLKKIPKNRLTKLIKVNLPHSLVKDTDEVCLITGDLDKKNRKAEIEPDILHYKAMLEDHGINHISEVITLRQLRTEYKPYEAKQKLLAAYDLFLADNKIAECLPRVLGRHFFKKRKFPIQINMKTRNLKQQIEKALSTKVFYITGHGNCCASEVAYLDMADCKIIENVMTMVDVLAKDVPGTWCNIMGLYLKTARSKAIPLYMSYDGPNGVELQEVKEGDDVLVDELSTIPNIQVKVHSNGRVETVRVEEEMETCENNTENKNCDSELQELENEFSDTEKSEKKRPKHGKSEKEAKSAKQKENKRKEPKSQNQSPKKGTKHVKTEKVAKFAKQKKENVMEEPASQDQFQKKVEYLEENKMMASKRKRVKSESLLDSRKSVEKTETPLQAIKKRKIEGLNMKRYQSMKESKKINKKKNRRRTKQET